MALGKNCGSNVKSVDEGLGLGFVHYPRSFRRKRILISSRVEAESTFVSTPTKKQCSDQMSVLSSEKSLLETLPQDILIKILCGVNHDDLKQLFHVSKLIREASMIAKQLHFAYSTPTKTLTFQNPIDLEDSIEIEAPNAPKQSRRCRSHLTGKKLADISVALFTSPDGEQWPKEVSFAGMEIDI
ncbi:F-box protein At1g61340 [Cornus florida]|uniref:F-box protein At1g61340 n=1 Tax=Cornus florida TaxID=4283 RepID=UPI002897D391|nr:F-box protein At1g61340 [Cornus florida]XP_059659743.1 F-box protein At1g61340 [Cornus florida]